ncbi:MAG TPA: hypothetical protein VGK02_08685 [Candidatus Aquicultor sp.]
MVGVGPTELGVLFIMVIFSLIPLAITIWLIISIQAIKKSLKNIEHSIEGRSSR